MIEYLFLLLFVLGVVMYLLDRKGWHATLKRMSKIIRSHIESAKPLKKIEKQIKKQEHDTWTAEFEGRTSQDDPKHKIIRTWYAKVNYSLYPHFQCACGYSDWHINTTAAFKKSKGHVDEQNRAEELLRNNGGTHAW